MTDLLLTKTAETATTITLSWTPPPGAAGYIFYADGKKVSSTLDGKRSSVKFGKVASGNYEVDALAVTAVGHYPAVTPPNVKFVQPGSMPAAVTAAIAGDTLVAVGGVHPKLTLNRSIGLGRVTIGCDATSWLAGVDVGGQKGWRFAPVGDPFAFHSKIPVELVDYNVTPFYASGACDVIVGGLLEGGYDGIKQYGRGTVVVDGAIAQGNGGDCCHVNGAVSIIFRNYVGRDPVDAGAEHHDGIQVQYADYVHIGPGVDISWPVTPRRDEPNNGMFLNGETSTGIGLIEIDGATIHDWWGGRGFQLLAARRATIRNLQVVNCGDGNPFPGPGSPPITLGGVQGAGMVYDLYGVDQSLVYMNNNYATVNFH
jgi:hypothetical protein